MLILEVRTCEVGREGGSKGGRRVINTRDFHLRPLPAMILPAQWFMQLRHVNTFVIFLVNWLFMPLFHLPA